MDERKIALIRSSWAAAAANPQMATELFYGRLFRIAPEVRPLFADDIRKQAAKLADTLGFIVDHIDRPDALLPAAEALALRHVRYGVSAAHYVHIGTALIWTLRQLLGPRFDAETEAAWTEAYAALSGAMIAAAYPGETLPA